MLYIEWTMNKVKPRNLCLEQWFDQTKYIIELNSIRRSKLMRLSTSTFLLFTYLNWNPPQSAKTKDQRPKTMRCHFMFTRFICKSSSSKNRFRKWIDGPFVLQNKVIQLNFLHQLITDAQRQWRKCNFLLVSVSVSVSNLNSIFDFI